MLAVDDRISYKVEGVIDYNRYLLYVAGISKS